MATEEITEDNFTKTIRTCEMEDCLLESARFKDYTDMKETEVLCNLNLYVSTNFSEIGCCSEEDLIAKCDSVMTYIHHYCTRISD